MSSDAQPLPDLTIIGAGPAALTAALYAARFGLSVQVLEKGAYGGTLAQISDLHNYPGFQGAGATLAQQMQQQVAAYPAVKFRYAECTALQVAPASAAPTNSGAAPRPAFELSLDGEEQLLSRAVLVASGASPRHLDFELNVPVSYCAICDGELARGRRVAVVGGANAAVQESIFLAPLARTVDLFTHSQLKADQALQAELREFANVTIHEQVEPTPALLNQFDYVFVFIGQVPATSFLSSLPEFPQLVDASGRLLTGSSAQPVDSAAPCRLPHQTILPGLFAAGDVRSGAVRQVITAAGDGAAAAIEIAQFLNPTK